MLMSKLRNSFVLAAAMLLAGVSEQARADLDIAQGPLFSQSAVAPLNLLVMGRDTKLYFEAYNDASDLNGDGQLDVGYKPSIITYFGYFNSNACYNYSSGRFVPVSLTATKRCSGAWSGDFLNYVTTSRIDALRKVLYGGKRSNDTSTDTTLERAYVPREGHSWGKEYESVARDGYNIADYTPLSAPSAGLRILFASTTNSQDGEPVMRVMTEAPWRIWNWLSIEGPIAAGDCFTEANARVSCTGTTASGHPGHPANHAEYDTMVTNNATAARLQGSGTIANIDCTANCNPFGAQDNFLTVMTGTIHINAGRGGNYRFSIDGDDAVELIFNGPGGPQIVGAYGGHGMCNCDTSTTANIALLANTDYTFTVRHEEAAGGEGFRLRWSRNGGGYSTVPNMSAGATNGGIAAPGVAISTYSLGTITSGASGITDYTVRVQVCASDALKEDNCRLYPSGTLKPTGLLHDYADDDSMLFGLITGTYFNNTEGGVLRRAVRSFRSEYDTNSGIFNSGVNGIVKTLNALKVVGFRYSGNQYSFDSSCGALGTRALNNGECSDWGNPIAEMMYEGVRYFAGAAAATPRYATGGSTTGQTYETNLGLPTATWTDPYNVTTGYPSCAKPFETVISDINPNYDGGLPGNPFGETTPDGTTPSALSSFNAATEGATIWTQEFGGAKDIFIGQSGATANAAPTAKSASSFGNIRGLAPEEPSKGGTFYAASVSRFAFLNDISAASGLQKMRTYSVALASPLPRIEFPINGRVVTLVPFAKTVGGAFSVSNTAAFQPTNTIVDFYVERIVNVPGQPTDTSVNGGRPYAVFRINYEDVEQGNDFDMDAIVRYLIQANADNTVTVTLNSEYAAGGAIQYMGYVMSGTTADGIYLEVRDVDTSTAVTYKFNTPTGRTPGYCDVGSPPADCNGLPTTQTRTFTPGAGVNAASLLRDPLYFAAKYGGYTDANSNGIPEGVEWDANGNGEPDNYFLVTNALGLKQQLRNAFDAIVATARDTGSLTISGVRVDGNSLSYIPRFNPNEWTGDLKAFRLNNDATLGTEVWSASARLPSPATRNIVTMVTPGINSARVAEPLRTTSFANDTAALAAIGLTATDLTSRFGGLTTAQIYDYLRGDAAKERSNLGPLRNRTDKIGDIIGSLPILTGPNDDYGYSSFPGPGGSTYASFVAGKVSQTPTVYVNANDGMLHAFNATNTTAGGTEIFAFIPSTARAKLGLLPSESYSHQYLNDGKINIGDAYLSSGWKTVLVSSVGAGGASVFALDVTSSTGFDKTKAMWEITGATDADLGYAIGRPVITVLPGNQWVAIHGNGLNSTNDDAVLFVTDLATGTVLRRITAAAGTDADPNGIINVSVGDVNQDGYADVAYAGDYKGNVWKFDLSSSTAASWVVANSGAALFTATGPSGETQRITGSMELSRGPNNSILVYFGTGRYLLTGDNDVPASPPVDTFYTIQDNGTPITGGRTGLQRQTITLSGTDRQVSQNAVNYETQRGWYVDLGITTGVNVAGEGERFFGEPLVVAGEVLFITFQPLGSRCNPGGINRLYFLDSVTGARNSGGTSPCVSNGSCVLGDPAQPAQPPTTRPPVVIPQNNCLPGVDAGCTPPDPLTDPSACNPALGNCELSTGRCRLAAVNLAGAPIVLPRPCGRQSWRQIR